MDKWNWTEVVFIALLALSLLWLGYSVIRKSRSFSLRALKQARHKHLDIPSNPLLSSWVPIFLTLHHTSSNRLLTSRGKNEESWWSCRCGVVSSMRLRRRSERDWTFERGFLSVMTGLLVVRLQRYKSSWWLMTLEKVGKLTSKTQGSLHRSDPH